MNAESQVDVFNYYLNGDLLLQDLTLFVKLDTGKETKLNYKKTQESSKQDKHGDFKEIIYHFTDLEETILVSLKVKDYENFQLVYVTFQIKNERAQSRHRSLAPENGILIRVERLGEISGLLAHYQHKDWWTRPHFTKDISSIPERTQFLLWKKQENYYSLLPVTDQAFTTRLAGEERGISIQLSSYAGGFDHSETLAFSIGKGKQPFELVEKMVSATIQHLGSPTLPRKNKRYPEILDYLGWCSWDAFYHQVNETGLIEKMEELNQKHVPVKWMMIDDGWLDVEDNRLNSFEANRTKFPGGLFPAVKKIKDQYGVNWVGVWHTIAGYWGGVLPDSKLAISYKEALYRTNTNQLIPNPDDLKGFKFWNDWHLYLKQQGIDFIKVDSQSAVNNFFMYHKPIGEAARGMHAALEASAGIHFDQCIINCMGMASENIWNRPISSLSRNSDDFVPGEEISFKEHALQNAYNSYYHGQFYWGDWDMFWTDHEEAVQNAVLRSVSGGPVYFSDRVGETNPELIWPLIFNNGKVIRADQPGLPTEDQLFVNPNEAPVPLKVWNTVNEAGILAAFNVHLEGESVVGSLSPQDIPILEGETFLVFDYFNHKTCLIKSDEKLDVVLEKDGVALFILLPLNKTVLPIGLLNKYLAPAAIEQTFSTDIRTIVRLKEGGKFGFYCEKDLKEVLVNGQLVSFEKEDNNLYIIDCFDYQESPMIEIVTK